MTWAALRFDIEIPRPPFAGRRCGLIKKFLGRGCYGKGVSKSIVSDRATAGCMWFCHYRAWIVDSRLGFNGVRMGEGEETSLIPSPWPLVAVHVGEPGEGYHGATFLNDIAQTQGLPFQSPPVDSHRCMNADRAPPRLLVWWSPSAVYMSFTSGFE